MALTPSAARQAAKADTSQRDNSDELAHYTSLGQIDRILVRQGHAFRLRKGYISDKYEVPDVFRKENHRFHDHHSSRGRQRQLVRVLTARSVFPKCASWTPTASRSA